MEEKGKKEDEREREKRKKGRAEKVRGKSARGGGRGSEGRHRSQAISIFSLRGLGNSFQHIHYLISPTIRMDCFVHRCLSGYALPDTENHK